MTASRPPFPFHDTTPTTLADHPPQSTSRSHYYDPSPRNPPYTELERHPRSVIQPVQISTEFLLKPQSQSHSGLAPHFLNFAALRGKAAVNSSQAKSDRSEGDSIAQNLDPWFTTSNSTNVQDGQMHEASAGNVDEYPRCSGAGDYLPASNQLAFPPPPMPLPPHPEYLYGSHCLTPVQPLAAHQPIPPEQHSTYSELAPHLEFMEKMQQQELKDQHVAPSRQVRQTARQSPKARERQSIFPSPIERSRRPEPRSGSSKILGRTVERPTSKLPKSGRMPFPTPPPERDQELSESSEVGSTSSRNHKEPKRPSLACTFCRERKIACDRWTEGGMDSTTPCTACALRSFDCVFVHKTSKINQLKRT